MSKGVQCTQIRFRAIPLKKLFKKENIMLMITITESTIAQMITLGNYDCTNENIAKKFQFNSAAIGTWEFKFISAGKAISSEEAKKLCEVDGLQSGSVEHLLALGAALPNLQKQNPIIALGSVCGIGGDRSVPALWFGDGRRELGLNWWSNGWFDGYRFLSVRKVSDH